MGLLLLLKCSLKCCGLFGGARFRAKPGKRIHIPSGNSRRGRLVGGILAMLLHRRIIKFV